MSAVGASSTAEAPHSVYPSVGRCSPDCRYRLRGHASIIPTTTRSMARPTAGYLPMQNREKITPSRSSAVNSPVIDASAFCASRSSSA